MEVAVLVLRGQITSSTRNIANILAFALAAFAAPVNELQLIISTKIILSPVPAFLPHEPMHWITHPVQGVPNFS
jgi:hypothetical protein